MNAGPIVLAPNELWCRVCGSNSHALEQRGDDKSTRVQACTWCGSTNLVPADQVLQPGEYIIPAPSRDIVGTNSPPVVGGPGGPPSTAKRLLPVETPSDPLRGRANVRHATRDPL